MKLIIIIMTLSTTNNFAQTPKKKEIVPLNGTDIYYEVYGRRDPLFMLHAFTQSSMS